MAAVFIQFQWMAIAAIVFGFFMAFGIGANDVANAFGTSVASKAITMKQALLIASIFEFGGAVLLGASVTKTVRKGIIKTEYYEDQPEILMLGMLCSLVIASILLFSATALEMPVSTTHTIVGSIVGFSLAAKGFDSVNWNTCIKIFVSWIASPGITGLLGFIMFFTLRKIVLESSNPYPRAVATYPVVLFGAVSLNVYFVLKKAGKNKFKLTRPMTIGIVLGCGAFCALAFVLVFRKGIMKKIEKKMDAKEAEVAAKEEATRAKEAKETEEAEGGKKDDTSEDDEEEEPIKKSGVWDKFANATYKQDLESQSMHESVRANEIWDQAIKYDPRAEELFSYLQVFTACLAAFAHGANDVANAMGPVAAIIGIYESGSLATKSAVPIWILAMGGGGIVIGFLLFGYKIIKALGYKLTFMAPSKGFIAELAASITVIIASFLGIPVSSTQCLVGGVSGTALGAGQGCGQLDKMYLLRVACGWVVCFFAVVVLNAGFFSFAAYSPSLIAN